MKQLEMQNGDVVDADSDTDTETDCEHDWVNFTTVAIERCRRCGAQRLTDAD